MEKQEKHGTSEKRLETVCKELICSEDFENALNEGVSKYNEIGGSLKSRNKDNYAFFYDIMLKSRTDVQSALDKKKRNRTAEENELVKRFVADVKSQYKFVKEMIFLCSDEEADADGLPNRLPKKLTQLVDKIAAVASMLAYIGHGEFEEELGKRGITLKYRSLEETSEVFENEDVKADVKSVFETSCRIQKEVDDTKTEISEVIFENSVCQELRYDRDLNPYGIKASDFAKLVSVKAKIDKAKTDENREKAEETANATAEEKTFDITRSEILRAKYLEMSERKDG